MRNIRNAAMFHQVGCLQVKDEAIGRRFLSWEGGTFQQRLQYY
jgi:hypothetical protein